MSKDTLVNDRDELADAMREHHQTEEWARLYESGLSCDQIARRNTVSRWVVYRALVSAGVPMRTRGRRKGVKYPPRVPLVQEEAEEVSSSWLSGESMTRIATRLGLPYGQVVDFIRTWRSRRWRIGAGNDVELALSAGGSNDDK